MAFRINRAAPRSDVVPARTALGRAGVHLELGLRRTVAMAATVCCAWDIASRWWHGLAVRMQEERRSPESVGRTFHTAAVWGLASPVTAFKRRLVAYGTAAHACAEVLRAQGRVAAAASLMDNASDLLLHSGLAFRNDGRIVDGVIRGGFRSGFAVFVDVHRPPLEW